jgi:integrase
VLARGFWRGLQTIFTRSFLLLSLRRWLAQYPGALLDHGVAQPLPVVLSREEVFRVLSAIRFSVYRACLSTIYSCGLRLTEGAFLKVQDIDSSRMMVRVLSKGSKERDVPLPERTLFLLREFWRRHRSKKWLFPARIRHNGYSEPVNPKNVQTGFRRRSQKQRCDSTSRSRCRPPTPKAFHRGH